MPETKLLLTITAAAEALSVCPFTIRRLIWRGDLRSVRVGRALRVRRDDLTAWIAENTERSGEQSMAKLRQSGREVAHFQ